MSTLFEAMNQEVVTTENGMKTNMTSLNSCVDLFFHFGASRGKDIIPDFSKAFAENTDIATRIALWGRDVREGAGERQLFRDVLRYLIEKDETDICVILDKISEIGRWDDLFVAFETKYESYACEIIEIALRNKNGLCAKWMPRKGKNANILRKYLKLTPKQYRKLLVSLTNVVETPMCAKEFDTIDYSKIPSLASARYTNAFKRNDEQRYNAYIESLKKGEAKVNAGAVYPYDVIKTLNSGQADFANEQWKALPDYLKDSNEKILVVVDTSGSMESNITSNLTAMDVSVSLGLYLSERLKGYFENSFITFSSNPSIQHLKGSLSDKYEQLCEADWSMSTNLEAVFNLVLTTARSHNVSKEDMPSMILIISDMEFNEGVKYDLNASKLIEQYYKDAGYEMPKVVFWNVNARNRQNFPATSKQQNIALISGFSPSIMTSVLAGKDFTPEGIMLETVMKDRYKV